MKLSGLGAKEWELLLWEVCCGSWTPKATASTNDLTATIACSAWKMDAFCVSEPYLFTSGSNSHPKCYENTILPGTCACLNQAGSGPRRIVALLGIAWHRFASIRLARLRSHRLRIASLWWDSPCLDSPRFAFALVRLARLRLASPVPCKARFALLPPPPL